MHVIIYSVTPMHQNMYILPSVTFHTEYVETSKLVRQIHTGKHVLVQINKRLVPDMAKKMLSTNEDATLSKNWTDRPRHLIPRRAQPILIFKKRSISEPEEIIFSDVHKPLYEVNAFQTWCPYLFWVKIKNNLVYPEYDELKCERPVSFSINDRCSQSTYKCETIWNIISSGLCVNIQTKPRR